MTRAEAVNWIINISADIGKMQHQELWHYEQALAEIKELLEMPQQRKTGKWIWVQYDSISELGDWYCSECGFMPSSFNLAKKHLNYCPSCGSRMECEENAIH